MPKTKKRRYRFYNWHRLNRRGTIISIPSATTSTHSALSQHKRMHGGQYKTRVTRGGTLIVERVR